jgi:hypothetical protein
VIWEPIKSPGVSRRKGVEREPAEAGSDRADESVPFLGRLPRLPEKKSEAALRERMRNLSESALRKRGLEPGATPPPGVKWDKEAGSD